MAAYELRVETGEFQSRSLAKGSRWANQAFPDIVDFYDTAAARASRRIDPGRIQSDA
jgi:hypothetical protein